MKKTKVIPVNRIIGRQFFKQNGPSGQEVETFRRKRSRETVACFALPNLTVASFCV